MKKSYIFAVILSAAATPFVSAMDIKPGDIPVKRPLVEEYTYLTCAFCPRGYVAMEELNELFGHLFVPIAYHYADEMGAKYLGDGFPADVKDYPAGTIDRGSIIDPGGFYTAYPKAVAKEAKAFIEVEAKWADEEESQINVKTTVAFTDDYEDADFRIAHILVVDGLSNPNWVQYNNFSWVADPSQYPGKWWELFVMQSQYITGLTFNFVAAYSDATKGVEGSVPSSITAYEPIEYTSEIPTELVVNGAGQDFVTPNGGFANARVVSILIDNNTGEVLNCNKSDYLGAFTDEEEGGNTSGLVSLPAGEVSGIGYFDLNGRPVSNPGKGIFLKVETRSDGTRTTSKVINP